MSLILDALKKLERDKDAREPNVLVVGSVPWGARARSRLPLLAGLAAAGVLGLAALALWPRDRSASRPAAVPSPAPSAVATPSAAPSGASIVATPAPAPGAAPEPRRTSVPSGPRAVAGDEPVEHAEGSAEGAQEAPPRRGASGPEALRLTAISRRDGRPVALINDRLVFEGDGFDGVKVLRIGESEVEVEVRGVRRVLRF